MATRITDTEMTSDQTRHKAELAKLPSPLTGYSWQVTWLPGQHLTRDQAITAMTLAEFVIVHADDLADTAHKTWLFIEGWAAELGLSGPEAAAMASPGPGDVLSSGGRQEPGKRCTKCGEVKLPGEFYRDKSRPDDLTCWCKNCSGEAKSRWSDANLEAKREIGRTYMRLRRATNPEAARERIRGWRAANPDANRKSNRDSKRRQHAANREAVLGHYGRACECCGSAERLTIDHANGDGGRHREQIGHGSTRLYRWLVANGFPDGFRVMCRPCNQSKGKGDRCRIDHAADGAR